MGRKRPFLVLVTGNLLPWACMLLMSSALRGETMQQSSSAAKNDVAPMVNWESARNSRDVLEFCTLVCSHDVDRHLATDDQLNRAARELRDLCVTKVYLETIRDGYRPKDSTLRKAKTFFLKEGFDVGSAITTTAGGDFGTKCSGTGMWLCYSSDKTRRDLAQITAYTATLFDEFIFDDFLCTDCQCDTCQQLKGDLTWSEFRTKQMAEVSRDYILRPGHAANPNAKIIIKYPQWYDKFHDRGYDARAETDAFDYIWIGTETRDPETPRFGFVEPYESFFIYRWLSSVAGVKTRGGWFDCGDCYPRVYVDQCYQTILGGTREILLFNFYDIALNEGTVPLLSALKKDIPRFYDLAKRVRGKQPGGINAYKPVNSDGGTEDFIFDYIGMLGIPLVPCSEFPTNARAVLLTTHAATDKDIISKLQRHASSGGSLVATPAFLRSFGTNSALLNLFGYPKLPQRDQTVKAQAFDVEATICRSDKPVDLAVLPRPSNASVIASGIAENGDNVPVITAKDIGSGSRAILLNLRTADIGPELLMDRRVSFLRMPTAVLNRAREVVLAPTGLTMLAPARVGLYPFSDDLVVLYNYNGHNVSVQLRFRELTDHKQPRELVNPWREQRFVSSEPGSFTIQLDAGEIAPLELK